MMTMVVFSATALPDFKDYQLTEDQIELLKRLESRGFTEEQLIGAAGAFMKANQPQDRTYIPPHTKADLEAVTVWAEGRAFGIFAQRAGFHFDWVAYEMDCPHPSLFNFGQNTGLEFLDQDVTSLFLNMDYGLRIAWVKSQGQQEIFRAMYLDLLEGTPFFKYLSDFTN